MTSEEELEIIRQAYAKQVLGAAGVADSRIESAFASVRRERFVGPGPWQIFRWTGYRQTSSDDPTYLYTDDVVAIDPKQQINNGQPQLHAHLINQASPQPGDHVVHVGAGTGYYTALMAHIVGQTGRVTGIEVDRELARRARQNFEGWENVKIIEGDGARISFDPADVIYVNAGATRPADVWLDQLKDGGRLILPLTTNKAFGDFGKPPHEMVRQGAVFRIERRCDDYLAKWISSVAIFPCVGARDESSERALAEALAKGRLEQVTRLYRDEAVDDGRCWLKDRGWRLAYR